MPITVLGLIFTTLLIAFGFAGLAIRWQYDYKLRREQIRAGAADSSLGASELRALIQEAVLDSVAPIEDRLDRIEQHMRQLPERTASSDAGQAQGEAP